MEDEMKDTGTLAGHVGPGSFILIISFLWTYNNLLRYHTARKEALYTGQEGAEFCYKSSLFSKYDSSSYVLAEPCAVILLGIIAFFGEMISVASEIEPLAMGVHHVHMYLCYVIMAFGAIFRHRKYEIPPNAEHAVFLVANAAEGYIFINHHQHGLSQKVHFSIALLNFATAICVACEIAHRRSVLAALGRTLSFMTQGIWFIFVGFLLYPPSFMPKWEATDRFKEDVTTLLVVLDVLLVTLLGLVMNFVIAQRVQKFNMATLNRTVACFGYTKVSLSGKSVEEKKLYSDEGSLEVKSNKIAQSVLETSA